MCFIVVSKPLRIRESFLVALLLIISLPNAVASQTGLGAAHRPIDDVVLVHKTTAQDALAHIKSQPQLEPHLQRINHFRLLLKQQNDQVIMLSSKVSFVKPVLTANSPVIPRGQDAEDNDTAAVAILELEMSIAARTGPTTLYPGAGIVMVLSKVSDWSERNMIKALNDGGTPIYSHVGHLIGVEDPDTGRLLGGRRH